MELQVHNMEIYVHKNSKSVCALFCFLILILILLVANNALAQSNEDLGLAGSTTDSGAVSHTSRAVKYAQLGYNASIDGQWHKARQGWEKAVEHLELSNASDRNRAVFYYEYGHAAGITCEFDIAEEFIEKSYQLEKAFNGPYVLTLVEMFRLYFDQQQYKMASIYFEAALPNLKAAHADETTPIRFVYLLDEYAKTLLQIGNPRLATQIRRQATEIKTRFGMDDVVEQRIRYGSDCGETEGATKHEIVQSQLPIESVSNRISKIRDILRNMDSIKK